MSSSVPAAVYILRILAGVAAGICSYFFHVSGFPPQVPSLFAGYDNGLLYALSPCGFLSRCQQRCGPIYRVSLGPWRLVVISSGNAISSIFSVPSQLLSVDILHQKMLYVVAGVQSNFARLHEVTIREIFSLLDKTLSQHSLGQTTQAFGLVLLSQIKDFARDHSGPISLTELTNKPLFAATNFIMFGSAFPTDIYRDFCTLNKSVPYRFCGTLLWHFPSYAARMRLLKSLRNYSQRGEVVNGDSTLSRGFMKIFKDNNIRPSDEAILILNFIWALHSNTLNNAFFSLSFLLVDPDGFARVQTEIDSAVEKFGSLEELLQAGPTELDDPSFKLLTSAIMETMRLTSLHVMRQATRDLDLRLKDGRTISIKKGELLFGNVHAAHMDKEVLPNPETFVVDRFAQHPYERKHLQTEGYPVHALGGGKHICKGRWLAIYELKVLLIILLRTFDFSPAENSVGWCLPRVHPRSIGVVHTDDDIHVQLSPRRVKDGC